MTLEEISRLVKENGKTKEEQIRILRKKRAELLVEIHEKQQTLDGVDYMIYEIKKGGR